MQYKALPFAKSHLKYMLSLCIMMAIYSSSIDYNGIRRMINVKSDSHHESTSTLEQLTTQYEAVLNSNFEKQESQLVEQLYEQAKVLKKELQFFKREVGQQNIDKLIGERRREKQKERQSLQSKWRLCNQSFKKLQQQEKILNNELIQARFDLKNIEQKIQEFNNKQQLLYSTAQQKKVVQKIAEQEPAIERSSQFITQSSNELLLRQNVSRHLENIQKIQRKGQTSDLKRSIFTEKTNIEESRWNSQGLKMQKSMVNKDQVSRDSKDIKLNGLKMNNSVLKVKLVTQYSKQKDVKKGKIYDFLMDGRIREKVFELLYRKI